MDIKKIGITGAVGFVVMGIIGGITTVLFYEGHMTLLSEKFPGVVQFPPDMAPAMIGGLVYVFVMAIIYDKMGVLGVINGAITGAWFGGTKWFFMNMQMAGLMPNVWGDMTYIVIDVFITGIMYGISGAAMGWALEKFKK
ncbi:hypothetical protein N9E12_03400 [Candidatus Marinimicrobia bacterium]|nr:hypothetical protein [Candidatus Neomarinimicrobiota bacterium]